MAGYKKIGDSSTNESIIYPEIIKDCQMYDNLKYGGFSIGFYCGYWEESHQEMQSGKRNGNGSGGFNQAG